MPLIHFAFGGLWREGKIQEQVDAFVECILATKSLKAFICPEYLPIINSGKGLVGDPDSMKVMEGGGVTWGRWVKPPPVMLLPCEVCMVSFVDVPFAKLRKWAPAEHYGRVGIAFSDDFRRRLHVQRVTYYQYPDLARDPFVKRYNQATAEKNETLRTQLSQVLLHHRKPATLWPELNGLFAAVRVTETKSGTTFEKQTYSRYDEGYDFRIEREARIITEKEAPNVPFEETEVLRIFVPDEKSGERVGEHIDSYWTCKPPVEVFPA
jgi:hypothetical protein